MNAIDELRRDLYRFRTARWIQSAVTASKTEDLGDTVAVMEFEKERANDVVKARDTVRRMSRCRRAFVSGRRKASLEGQPARTASPGSAPISIRSGMRSSSLIGWVWVKSKRGSPRVGVFIGKEPSTPIACATGCALCSSKSQFTLQATGAAPFTSALAPAA